MSVKNDLRTKELDSNSVIIENGIDQVFIAAKEVFEKDENNFVDQNGIPYQQLSIFDI